MVVITPSVSTVLNIHLTVLSKSYHNFTFRMQRLTLLWKYLTMYNLQEK